MGVVTSIFSRDATPLAEDPLGGEGRADVLSFLLFRLKDMGEDVTPASGVDSRPHREHAFVQACHQAIGSPSVSPDGRGGARHRSHGKSDTGYGAFRARRAQQNDPVLVSSAHHAVRDESYAHGVPGVPRKTQGRAGVSGPSHCRDMATRRLPMRRTRTGPATLPQASQGNAGHPRATQGIRAHEYQVTDYEYIANTAQRAINGYTVPMTLHLDHGKTLGDVRQAVNAGFTSTMIDGATLPFEENIRFSRQAVGRRRRPARAWPGRGHPHPPPHGRAGSTRRRRP